MNPATEFNINQLIIMGGPLMLPLIVCSFFGLGIIFEKFFYFSAIRKRASHLKEKIFVNLKNNNLKEAVDICQNNASPLANVFCAGILKFGCSRAEIKEAMEEVTLLEIPRFEEHLRILFAITTIAPLFGLLGTVTGMTSLFYAIQIKSAAGNPPILADIAGGVYAALLSTVAGLCVAIPTYIAYHYFISQIHSFIVEIDREALELLNFFSHLSESEHTNIN